MITVSCPKPGEGQMLQTPQRRLPRTAALAAVLLLLCALMLPASAALAQTPARIDNIWGGFDHQPSEAQVQSAERARGVAPSAQEESSEAQTVRQLDQELLSGVGP